MSEDTLYRSDVPVRPLRANGNLSYLDFIRVVESVWIEAHPDIPLIAAGLPVDSRYPCIVYGLVNRTTHPNEPKPRQREVLVNENGKDFLIISAQRYTNWVKFTAMDEVHNDGTQMAEELIEVFEDFMLEYTPLFKYLGLSDFMYMRRIADDEESRSGAEGVVKRAVVYSVTTEKQVDTTESKLNSILATITIGAIAEKDCDTEDEPRDLYRAEIS